MARQTGFPTAVRKKKGLRACAAGSLTRSEPFASENQGPGRRVITSSRRSIIHSAAAAAGRVASIKARADRSSQPISCNRRSLTREKAETACIGIRVRLLYFLSASLAEANGVRSPASQQGRTSETRDSSPREDCVVGCIVPALRLAHLKGGGRSFHRLFEARRNRAGLYAGADWAR